MFYINPQLIDAIQMEKVRGIEAAQLRSLAKAFRSTDRERRSVRALMWFRTQKPATS